MATATQTPLPTPTTITDVVVRARAEFDIQSQPNGSTQMNLIKKSYASGACSIGQCIDYSDITITDIESTTFDLTQSEQFFNVDPSNPNDDLQGIVSLTIGNLFDNNLFVCGGFKCTSALIRIYTTNATGQELGPGLYDPVSQQSIPIFVTSPLFFTPTEIPYLQLPSSLVLDSIALPVQQQVVSLNSGDFANDVYPIMADFTSAGPGNYKAHVVVEYDLGSAREQLLGSRSPHNPTILYSVPPYNSGLQGQMSVTNPATLTKAFIGMTTEFPAQKYAPNGSIFVTITNDNTGATVATSVDSINPNTTTLFTGNPQTSPWVNTGTLANSFEQQVEFDFSSSTPTVLSPSIPIYDIWLWNLNTGQVIWQFQDWALYGLQ
jgi:hypothetical protein